MTNPAAFMLRTAERVLNQNRPKNERMMPPVESHPFIIERHCQKHLETVRTLRFRQVRCHLCDFQIVLSLRKPMMSWELRRTIVTVDRPGPAVSRRVVSAPAPPIRLTATRLGRAGEMALHASIG